MRHLRRVYYNGPVENIKESDVIELGESESRKLKTVLRANIGDTCEVLTPTHLCFGEIFISSKKSVQVRITESREINLLDYNLIAYQCIAKREYMDVIIEKYSELGVSEVYPVISSRSLDVNKSNTMDRYNQIAIDSSLQCEREQVLKINDPIKIERIKLKTKENFLFHERLGEKVMPEISGRDISFIIGPEGGFTDKEYNHLINIGFKAYTPIDTILKAETAAVLFAGMIKLNLK